MTEVLKTNQGNADEFLNQTPSNLQKPLGDCEKVTQRHKKQRNPLYPRGWCTSFGSTNTHSCFCGSVCVITALLVDASSFPQQPKRKLERNIRRSLPRPGCFLLYSVEFICKQSCATGQGSKGQENRPLLSSFRSSLVCTANEPRTRRPLCPVVSPLIAELFLITSSP